MATSKGQPVTGHVDLIYPTDYVKAADLRGKDVTIVVAAVTWENLVMAGGKRDRKVAITMHTVAGKPLGKKWIAGKTVCKQIAAALGEKHAEKWVGGKVTMYPTTTRGARGEEMECIRVRARPNAQATDVTEDMAREPEPKRDFADELEDAGAP